MRPIEYDLKIIRAIKALRILKCIKQINIANALQISQPSYCKIESGIWAITVGQMRIIAKELDVSTTQILTIAEADFIINFKITPLSEILLKFVLMLENKNENDDFEKEEMEFILSKIKEGYRKSQKNLI